MRHKLTIEYDGTGFLGWQKQDDGLTVQEVIETAIFNLTKEKAALYASGRTDAGVHALAQIAHFDLSTPYDSHKLLTGINHFMRPHKISIIECEEVSNDFHARFSAQKRHYKYIILNRPSPPAIYENRVWHVRANLDIAKMLEAASYLIGNHDFSSFRAKECQAKSPIKTMEKIDITKDGDFVIFHFSSKSFLHHMVRNIVGTLKAVGAGIFEPAEMADILASKDRAKAGVTAPAEGLYFLGVDY